MKLNEFIVKNISDIHVVVRTPSSTFGLNPTQEQVVVCSKLSEIIAPKELVDIRNGKRVYFKTNESIVEINHDGKILSGKELKLSDVEDDLNSKLKEVVETKVEKIIEETNELVEEIKETVDTAKAETVIEPEETPKEEAPAPKKRRGRKPKAKQEEV